MNLKEVVIDEKNQILQKDEASVSIMSVSFFRQITLYLTESMHNHVEIITEDG